MADWSLQAIVRGSSGEFGKMDMDGPDSFLQALTSDHHHQFDQDLRSSFPDIFEGSTGSSGDELEELYKPFYPAPVSHESLPDHTTLEFQEQEQNAAEDKPSTHDQSDQSSVTSPVASVTAVYTPKYKKRKNQHKRVVIQVSAEGLTSDMWAWRKYGQKPIKGSPYPRSYYRCSSSKGCLARKQVEQSCTDPGMFIITYTAEHSHSQPTRRNSLAGTVRQKFPSPKQDKTTENSKSRQQQQQQPELMDVKPRIKQEEDAKPSDEFDVSDFVFNEDFFSGLEEFDEFAQPFPVRPCSWV
uniref:WRKY protein n=1 Tax=Salvia miltiorrhiza TaxID=226208 RepID=A0A0D5Y9B8_SALMI|nr:WRKY protein [Salvia miltiorrhiza]